MYECQDEGMCQACGSCTQGLGRTCLYCGDGINDLAALAAADVGMAIGSSDASAAADISDKHASVAGCHLDLSACLLT